MTICKAFISGSVVKNNQLATTKNEKTFSWSNEVWFSMLSLENLKKLNPILNMWVNAKQQVNAVITEECPLVKGEGTGSKTYSSVTVESVVHLLAKKVNDYCGKSFMIEVSFWTEQEATSHRWTVTKDKTT